MKILVLIYFGYLALVAPAPTKVPAPNVEPTVAPKDIEEPMMKKTHQVLTVEMLDGYLGLLKMFKDMLPLDLVNIMDNLNKTQKGEVVNFLSNWFQDQIQNPNTTTEVVDMLRQYLPSVYDKISAVNTTFYTKFDKLKPETQALLREWRVKAVDLLGDQRPAGETAAQNLQLLSDFAMSIRDVKPEIREDLKTQFPQAVSLTEGLGFTVFTTMIMVVQKIIETAAAVKGQGQAVLATGLPLECKIPLD